MAMVGREAVQEQIRWDAKRKDVRELVAEKHVRRRYDLDPDLLECPICSEAFSPPVYQCENGHSACSACCRSITRGCPSCSQPLGRIRNIAIEKLIESVQVECKHAYHGCNAMVKYTQKAKHENDLCQYRPIPCPVMRLQFAGCNYTGPKASIPMHLTENHGIRIVESSGPSASFRMRSSDGDVMVKAEEVWLIVCWVENFQGDAFHCDSVGSCKEVAYKLTAKPLNRETNKVYSMENVIHAESNWDEDFLLVPGGFEEHEISLSLL